MSHAETASLAPTLSRHGSGPAADLDPGTEFDTRVHTDPAAGSGPEPEGAAPDSDTALDATFDSRATFDSGAEFDRQVRTLLDKGYPALSGLSKRAFTQLVTPLREVVLAHGAMDPPTPARVPFVLVITKALAPADRSMPLTELLGRPGYADFEPDDIARFEAVEGLEIPDGHAYVVFDIDRGAETLGVTPDDAMVTITAQGRTPLTVDEGIALITHHPASLAKNNCFSLVGSRCGDRRVPALWISKRAPKLGWCWAGNPHTWLGSASCAARAGTP